MRTIYLLQNRNDEWYLRIGAGGKKISHTEDFDSAGNARRAFFTEGDYQPHARMIFIIEGQKPVLIRAHTKLPPRDPIAEAYMRDLIVAASRKRKAH